MPDPVITATTPTPITPAQPTPEAINGEKPFAEEMEEKFLAAFQEARPDKFPKRETKPPELTDDHETTSDKTNTKSASEDGKPPRAAQWKQVNEERARLKEENEKFKTEQEKWKTWYAERTAYDTIKK